MREGKNMVNELFKYGKCFFTKPNIENVDDMVEMMNNENISSMLFNGKRTVTKKQEIDWINKHQNDNTFSIYDIKSLKYIGNCGFNEIENDRGEIGLTICEGMQGKHYAKDIINGLIEYGYNTLNLDEIYCIIFSDNIRSLNCVKQLGFEEYKRDKNVLKRNGIEVDDIYFKLERK
ncbi:MAG: GNAT family N-acetyltransferase [Firmicutes bacterium]|nr:GNAT family N-acetyltransferase [Bacillota bacterium]